MLSGNAGYSARAIALEIDAGRLSPDEVFTEHQKAIDQLEEDIQAFTHRAEKMVAGKMRKYVAANALMEQPFVKDESQSVKQILGGAKVTAFARFAVGSM